MVGVASSGRGNSKGRGAGDYVHIVKKKTQGGIMSTLQKHGKGEMFTIQK